MIRTSALVTWTSDLLVASGDPAAVDGNGVLALVVRSRGVGETLPPNPDRLIVLSRTGGPGLQRENVFDIPTFHVRVRGAQRDPDDAELLADLVDRLYVDAPMPTTIDGRHVIRLARTGAPPTEDRRDPAGRTHLTCSYWLEQARYPVTT